MKKIYLLTFLFINIVSYSKNSYALENSELVFDIPKIDNVNENLKIEVLVQGRLLKFAQNTTFYKSGMVRQGFFQSSYGLKLKMSDGKIRVFKSLEDYFGTFDEQGRLVGARRKSGFVQLNNAFVSKKIIKQE